ncbi:MAG: hypothetical protein D6699_02140 [Aquificota bacterium]|nr:MAG: hypothetical protein D6699_02140 [Aquificota bacterium]
MELRIRIPLEGYEVKSYEDTGTMLIFRKDLSGEPDYAIEGDGFVIEFKNGEIYTIDVYDPETAKRLKKEFTLAITKRA